MTDDKNPIPEEFTDGTLVGDHAMIIGDDKVEMDIVGFDNSSFGVRPIEDFDQFLREQALAEAAAIERMTDEQRALTWGSKWIRFVRLIGVPFPLPIFGDTPTREKFAGMEDEPTIERYEGLLKRGYLFAFCSSVVEPGEWGTTHASTIAAALTDEQFAEARAWAWDPDELAERTEWFLEIARRSRVT